MSAFEKPLSLFQSSSNTIWKRNVSMKILNSIYVSIQEIEFLILISY